MPLRAHDKLAEAHFFLAALARSRGLLPRASYYASPAISALRSVTWVLRADLYPTHGARFESWWETRRVMLSTTGIGFALLTDVRNEATKVGAPLMRTIIRRDFQDGRIRAIELLLDPGFESLKNFRVRLDPPLTHITEGMPEMESAGNKAGSEMESLVPEFKIKLGLLRDGWLDGSVARTTVFGLKDELPFPVALAQLRAYASGLDVLLAAAEKDFAT